MSEAELVARLERLERDNRRLKRLGAVVLMAAALLGTMYTASCSSAGRRKGTQGILDKITAREFDLLDASGKLRVKIATGCSRPGYCWPSISLYDQSGKAATVIGAGELAISGKKYNTTLFDNAIQIEETSHGQNPGDIANLGVGWFGQGAGLVLSGKGGMSVQLMGQSALPGGLGGVLSLTGKNGNSVYLDSDSPMIEVAGGKGGAYMDLGRTDLMVARTGAKEQTSADSIVMFGNDKKHHVIWQAP